MNELHNVLTDDHLTKLRRWCLMRQDSGFHGRPGKPPDTCYSFWIGATLQLLEVNQLSNAKENKKYLLKMQDIIIGGFAKSDNNWPDPLHTYLGTLFISYIFNCFYIYQLSLYISTLMHPSQLNLKYFCSSRFMWIKSFRGSRFIYNESCFKYFSKSI